MGFAIGFLMVAAAFLFLSSTGGGDGEESSEAGSTEATVTINGSLTSLWEKNLLAIRAEAEYGFVVNDVDADRPRVPRSHVALRGLAHARPLRARLPARQRACVVAVPTEQGHSVV